MKSFALLPVSLLALALTACSLCEREVELPPQLDGLRSELGDRLAALWRAHGRVERWSEAAGLRCHYRVRFADGSEWEGRVGLVFAAPERVWLRQEGDSEREGEASAGGLARVERWQPVTLDVPPGWAEPVPVSFHEERARARASLLLRDFALSNLRNLLQIPFGVLGSGWELRRHVSPELVDGPAADELQATPERPALLGPYLFRCSPERQVPLDRVTYAACHPARPRGVFEVELDDYRDVEGVLIATRRRHFQRFPDPRIVDHDPLRPLGEVSVPEPVFVEELSELRFLSFEELGAYEGAPQPSEEEPPEALDERRTPAEIVERGPLASPRPGAVGRRLSGRAGR